MPPAPLLVTENLAVARGDRRLFSGFCLSVAAGELVHLSGRNGVGKTSLLETLAGLRQPEAGQVSAPVAEQLHWIGHRNALHPALSAAENLGFWCGVNACDAGLIPAALDRLQLKAARHRPARMLSTGQKRRAALARLLVTPRSCWLLDEPVAGLDVDGVALFAELLAEHSQRGGAAIFTSHQSLTVAGIALREVALA